MTTLPTLQVVSILVTMAPKLLELATWLVKKVSLNQKSRLPNGDEAETFTWRVETKCESKQTDKRYLFYQKSGICKIEGNPETHLSRKYQSNRITLIPSWIFPSDIWHLQQWFLSYWAQCMYQHITALTWVGTRTEQGRNNWSFL